MMLILCKDEFEIIFKVEDLNILYIVGGLCLTFFILGVLV